MYAPNQKSWLRHWLWAPTKLWYHFIFIYLKLHENIDVKCAWTLFPNTVQLQHCERINRNYANMHTCYVWNGYRYSKNDIRASLVWPRRATFWTISFPVVSTQFKWAALLRQSTSLIGWRSWIYVYNCKSVIKYNFMA